MTTHDARFREIVGRITERDRELLERLAFGPYPADAEDVLLADVSAWLAEPGAEAIITLTPVGSEVGLQMTESQHLAFRELAAFRGEPTSQLAAKVLAWRSTR